MFLEHVMWVASRGVTRDHNAPSSRLRASRMSNPARTLTEQATGLSSSRGSHSRTWATSEVVCERGPKLSQAPSGRLAGTRLSIVRLPINRNGPCKKQRTGWSRKRDPALEEMRGVADPCMRILSNKSPALAGLFRMIAAISVRGGLTACTNSRRFICNGALRFHATVAHT